MNKADLIDKISLKTDLPHCKVKQSVNEILKLMTETLKKGDHIEVRGFGSFHLRIYPTRLARNPKTGETFIKDNCFSLRFKPGKELKDRVNDK